MIPGTRLVMPRIVTADSQAAASAGIAYDSLELSDARPSRSVGTDKQPVPTPRAVRQPFGLPITPLTSQFTERISGNVILLPLGTRSFPLWS